MSALKVMKGFLIPAATAIAAVDNHNSGPHCAKKTQCVCRPSELPIYGTECSGCKVKAQPKPPSEIERNIGLIRQEVSVWTDDLKGYRERVVDFYETGMAHTASTRDFLREEANGPERYVAVGTASLSGYILGLRGGKLKRLSYATIAGLSMAAFCYPKDAAEYAELAIQEGNRYFVAGYHFVFGEKPKVPEWFSSVLGDQSNSSKPVQKK